MKNVKAIKEKIDKCGYIKIRFLCKKEIPPKLRQMTDQKIFQYI